MKKQSILLLLFFVFNILISGLIFSSCSSFKIVVAYPTKSATPTQIPTATASLTPTLTATITPTPLPTETATLTPTLTQTTQPSATPIPTQTFTPTPAWAKIPSDFTVANQFDIRFFNYGVGTQACGLISVCAALQDLGYPNADFASCIPALTAYTGNNYNPLIGIQPTDLCKAVGDAVDGNAFGADGAVQCYQPVNEEEAWQMMNDFRLMDWQVIVDVLILTDKTTSGTYFQNESPQPAYPDLPIAHFTRILGFKNDRKVAVAEILNPNIYNNPTYHWVLKENFLNAWKNPEKRTGYPLKVADEVNNWFMVISPPVE